MNALRKRRDKEKEDERKRGRRGSGGGRGLGGIEEGRVGKEGGKFEVEETDQSRQTRLEK